MQVSRLYSNKPDVFTPIDFNVGTEAVRLNVVLGEVRFPKEKRKDSHNLGKTTLVHLIDFMMLKGLSPDHFLQKHQDRFAAFHFYIEILLNSGEYATIGRSVATPTRIALTRRAEGRVDFSELPTEEWQHLDVPIDEAIKLLDAWLDLRPLKPYPYRKAITYFLRAQQDWNDVLQLQKFQAGKDVGWKPFVAHLFGFNEDLIARKYRLDESLQALRQRLGEQEGEIRYKENDLPGLSAELTVLRTHTEDLEQRLDSFRFDDEEKRLMRSLVETIEADIAALNQRIYDVRYDIRQIDVSLGHKDKFDLKEIQSIFDEAQLHFPGQLKKQYEDLVEFKKKVTAERNGALRKRRKELDAELTEAETTKSALDEARHQRLSVLRSTDTFEKFKSLQKDLTKQRAHLVYLEEQHRKLEAVAEAAMGVREQERELGRIVDEIKAMLSKPNVIYDRFRKVFNTYCQRVLDHEGIFYFFINSNGNLDYKLSLGLAGEIGIASSQADGTSYKKLVCALFDLALLQVYEGTPFFRFVYHDGIFEALDNRLKLALMDVVREQMASGKLQYIMTVISPDLPRDEYDGVLEFPAEEVVVHLHDGGADGRLFKMAEF